MPEVVFEPLREGVPAVTEKQWHDTVFEVLDERGPDFSYESPLKDEYGAPCKYFHEGAPSCLFGAVLDKLGVPQRYVPEGESIDAVMDELWSGIPFRVRRSSSNAQSDQDCGYRYSTVETKYRKGLVELQIWAD